MGTDGDFDCHFCLAASCMNGIYRNDNYDGCHNYAASGKNYGRHPYELWKTFPDEQITNGVPLEFTIQKVDSTISLWSGVRSGKRFKFQALVAVSEKNGKKGTW